MIKSRFKLSNQYTLGDILDSEFFRSQRLQSDFHVNWKDAEYWSWVIARYNSFKESLVNQEIVPKRIHQIWIGGKVPIKYDGWRSSWTKNNPDFEYFLWNEESILELGLINEKQFMQSKNPAVKSDIARYEILNKYGGLYADTDFESLKKIDSKLLTRSFIAGQVFSNSPQPNNGLMIAAPGSKFLNIVIESLPEYPGEMSPMEVLRYCGSFYLSKLIWMNKEVLDDLVILPSQYFYPWPNFMLRSEEDRYSWSTEETVAIHHWESSWMKNSITSRVLKKIRSFGSNA